MQEIPLPLVRANQGFIVGTILLAFALRSPALLAMVVIVQALPLLFGPKFHLVIAISRRILYTLLKGAATESALLQRFNHSLAVIMLCLALIAFRMGFPFWGWLFAGCVAAAAALALSGYCIGCVLYWRLKSLRARFSR